MTDERPHNLVSSLTLKQHVVRRLVFLIMVVMLGKVSPAYALFCGAKVVSEGASKLEVLQKCGDPTFAEQRVSYETVYVYPGGYPGPHQRETLRALPSPATPGRGAQPQNAPPASRDRSSPPRPAQGAFTPVYPPQPVVITILIDEWTYNFGPHSLMYRLSFADGVLRSITTLNYGYLP